MCEIIKNRYEFVYYLACTNANPNGDPDMGNAPRMDPENMIGLISDVATKRRIRNYVQFAYPEEPGMEIIMQQFTNINRLIAEVTSKVSDDEEVKVSKKPKKNKDSEYKATKKNISAAGQIACERFYDVRTFGAVMSTGPNAGQVRGPVQIAFGKSLDPILPLDISITRMCATIGHKDKTYEVYKELEDSSSIDDLRTMGRKQLIPFGLYEIRGFISANFAEKTKFSEKDLEILFEAIMNMYENDHSASKGEMNVVSPLIIFKHIGTDTNKEQREREARLGCAPAHKLFELIHVERKPDVKYPRSYHDYNASVDMNKVPNGVQIGFKPDAYSSIVWNKLPENEEWFVNNNE